MGEAAVIWGRLTEAFWLNCQLFGLTLLFALPLGLVAVSYTHLDVYKRQRPT